MELTPTEASSVDLAPATEVSLDYERGAIVNTFLVDEEIVDTAPVTNGLRPSWAGSLAVIPASAEDVELAPSVPSTLSLAASE